MIPFKDDEATHEELLRHVDALAVVLAVVSAAVALVCDVLIGI